MKRNLLSLSQFSAHNNAFIELLLDHFRERFVNGCSYTSGLIVRDCVHNYFFKYMNHTK